MADLPQHAHKLFSLVNLEQLYNQNPDSIILNDGAFIDQQLNKIFSTHLLSNIDGTLGYAPTCRCGSTWGMSKEGEYCPICDTVCSTKFVDTLNHNVWLSIPEHMPKVLSPIWYLILNNLASPKAYNRRTRKFEKVSFIHAIIDPDIDVSKYDPELLAVFGDNPEGNRGFKWLNEHMDEVIEALATNSTAKNQSSNSNKALKGLALRKLYETYKDTVFTSKIPVLHSSLHPSKTSGDNRLDIDDVTRGIMMAATNLRSDGDGRSRYRNTHRQKVSLYKIYSSIIEYAKAIVTTKIGGKKSLIRQHCLGSRLNFTFRAVVAAQDEILPLDEIKLPWGIMVNMFKLVILNMLTHRLHRTADDALVIFYNALTRYDPVVDKCLKDYINEYRDKKIPVILGRNP